MKRNLDYVRTILEKVEEHPAGEPMQQISGDFNDATSDEVIGHIDLMIKAGLLEGEAHPTQGYFYINGLSWTGHDFLDSARNATVWNATKERLKQAGGWTFELVGEILKAETKKLLGLGL